MRRYDVMLLFELLRTLRTEKERAADFFLPQQINDIVCDFKREEQCIRNGRKRLPFDDGLFRKVVTDDDVERFRDGAAAAVQELSALFKGQELTHRRIFIDKRCECIPVLTE